MSKYVRHQPVVSRQSDSNVDEDNWLSKIQKNLQKGGVQPKSVDNSLFYQINSIMNGKSKYPSVAAAVEDMKARSGLTDYLAKMNKISEETSEANSVKLSTAEDTNQVIDKHVPLVIKKVPGIKNTLQNYIRDTKGNLPIPAIIEKIKSIHRNDVSEAKDWDDDLLTRLVSKMNLEAKRDNPDSFQQYSNLGVRDRENDSDVDPSNSDAFHSLNPVKF